MSATPDGVYKGIPLAKLAQYAKIKARAEHPNTNENEAAVCRTLLTKMEAAWPGKKATRRAPAVPGIVDLVAELARADRMRQAGAEPETYGDFLRMVVGAFRATDISNAPWWERIAYNTADRLVMTALDRYADHMDDVTLEELLGLGGDDDQDEPRGTCRRSGGSGRRSGLFPSHRSRR